MKVKKFLIFFFLILVVIFAVLGVVFCFKLPFNINLDKHVSAKFAIPMINFILSFFSLLCCLYSFWSFTCLFPLNRTEEYLLDNTLDFEKNNNGSLTINIKKVEKGIFEIKSSEKTILINLSGYIFPNSYLKAFFIRNFNFKQINSAKLNLHNVFLGTKLSYLKNCNDIYLCVEGKKIKVVKNGKTVPTILSVIINYAPFWHIFWGRNEWRHNLAYYEKIDEKLYKQKCKK